jgi:hypothetical protein
MANCRCAAAINVALPAGDWGTAGLEGAESTTARRGAGGFIKASSSAVYGTGVASRISKRARRTVN